VAEPTATAVIVVREGDGPAVVGDVHDAPDAAVESLDPAVEAVGPVVRLERELAGPVAVALFAFSGEREPRVRDAVRDAADDRAEVRAVVAALVRREVVVPERDVVHDAVAIGHQNLRHRRAVGGDVHLDPGRAEDDLGEVREGHGREERPGDEPTGRRLRGTSRESEARRREEMTKRSDETKLLGSS
jgi:hypothetical protein